MLKLLVKYKWYLLLILATIIAEPAIASVLSFWLSDLFNAARPGSDVVYVLRLLCGGFLLWILKRIVAYVSAVLKSRFICNAKQDVKHRMFESLLGQNTANLSAIASGGEYISLFTNDIHLLEQRFFNQVISLISGIFSVLILGGSFLVLNAKLAVAILLFGVVAMFVPLVFSKKLNDKNLAYSNAVSDFTQRIKEYFSAYPTIKNYSIERAIAAKFSKINVKTEDSKFEADYMLNLANNVASLMSWFMQFIAVGLGIVLVIRGEIVIGTVVAAQSFSGDLALPLQNIIINANAIHSVKEIVKKLDAYTTAQPQQPVSAPPAPVVAEEIPGQIEFHDLDLELGGQKIIDHFSFCFEGGKKYLIVGLNGAGKSSLFRALKKWFVTCTGTITVAGRNVADMSSEELSHQVSYLSEHVSLFSGTVRENISLFRTVEEGEFAHAVDTAQVHLDLNRQIGDEGRNISSGEQRRIEIARSLLESVDTFVFDEVVSTLDIETAYEIEKQALEFTDKTVIFISHNFSGKLIRQYDEILVMDSGRLMAHGSYDELMGTCPYFQKICEIKFG